MLKTLINAFILLVALLLINGCGTSKAIGIEKKNFRDYQPESPVPQKMVIVYDKNDCAFKEVPWASLCDDEIRSLLPNQSAQVFMRKTDQSGKISYMTSTVSHESGSYEIIMDYMKYRIDDVVKDGIYYGSGKIGIGLRVTASVVTSKTDLNLSGLTNLGLEASRGSLKGYLSVEIVGIDSKDVTNLLPLIAKLDETSIQNALQAIATIKSKIWDDDVHLTPHIIAIQELEDSSIVIIKNELTNISVYGYTESSDLILKYWKPDGEHIDPEHQAELLEWMGKNNLENSAVKLVVFIHAKDTEFLGKKMIMDLNLK